MSTPSTSLGRVQYSRDQVITRVADAVFLNGLPTLCGEDRTVLSSDSFRDSPAIFKIDPTTGTSNVVLQDLSMRPPANSTRVPAIGINGLRSFGNYVCYTDSGISTLWRVAIHPDGSVAGP